MSTHFIAEHIKSIPFSGIRKFFDIANEMKDAVSLGVGEPDFFTPLHIREEAIKILEKTRTVYSSNAGMPELKEEIARYLERKYNISYQPETQVVVTVGGSEGIDISLRAIINPGDEVLVVEPCFVSYKPCVIMAGGIPVVINTKAENQFKVMPEEIERAITPKTKAIMISYPSNPTGAVMNKEDLAKIVKVLENKDILVITDEIYSELTYDKEPHVSIASFESMKDKTIVLNGFSKAFAMTGWRLGYAAGPKELISAMIKIHQYAIMCAPTVSQYAAIEALKNGDAAVQSMRQEYDTRRKLMLKGFKEIGMDCFEPLGAFYLFPSIQKSGLNSEDFCVTLLNTEKLAVVPGPAFGASGEGFIRCSYAYSTENLEAALERLGRFMRRYQ